jgi:alkylation response protein AidB-like acyl-CoA dehydrogenase
MSPALQPALGFGRRRLFDDDHQDFRDSFRRFLEEEIRPSFAAWETQGLIPREAYLRAARAGFAGMAVGEEHGGAGVSDFRFNAVIGEETQRLGLASFGVGLTNHNDVCLPYLLEYAHPGQRDRWLPGTVTGELLTAIALTEPGAGSDLTGIATRGAPVDGGWLVNGSKTFITCGFHAELFITAVRTDEARRTGLTLMVLEGTMDGFSRGRRLEKIGQHGQDTAELFFEDVFVPHENVLGEPGSGFSQIVANLPQERMTIAVAAQAAARAALSETLEYVAERRAFGKALSDLQATRFALAEMATELEIGQAYIDQSLADLVAGELSAEAAAIAKLWATEAQGRIVDRCLQLHGGYGYMSEYAIAQRYLDARVTRVYGGTSEIMKEIIGRALTRSGHTRQPAQSM